MHPYPVVYEECDVPQLDAYHGQIIHCGSSYGFFGYDNPPYNAWTTCRESAEVSLRYQFRRGNYWLPYIFNMSFLHEDTATCVWNMARWFWYIEGRMGWNHRTRIHWTPYGNVVLVEASGRWGRSDIAVSLLTLMLRVAPFCRDGMFMEEVLAKNPLALRTWEAIYRYLEGYQHFNGQYFCGWARSFGHKSRQEMEHLLIDHTVVEARAHRLWVYFDKPQDQSSIWNMASDEIRRGVP